MMGVLLLIGSCGLVLLLVSAFVDEFLSGVFEAFDSDLLSGTALGGLLTTLGFVGALVDSLTDDLLIATLTGLGAGVVVAAGVITLSRALARSANEHVVRTADFTGKTGTVVTSIPDGGFGQVNIVIAGHITRVSARAEEAVAQGQVVTVLSTLSPTSVLVRTDRAIELRRRNAYGELIADPDPPE